MMQGEQSTWREDASPMSNYFSAVNRNKRSLTLDLKHEKGKEILLALSNKADVVYVILLMPCQWI
jgi:succinate--hydroxymethylglutarate CoA-transferase